MQRAPNLSFHWKTGSDTPTARPPCTIIPQRVSVIISDVSFVLDVPVLLAYAIQLADNVTRLERRLEKLYMEAEVQADPAIPQESPPKEQELRSIGFQTGAWDPTVGRSQNDRLEHQALASEAYLVRS